MITLRPQSKRPTPEWIYKQLRFGVAVGLTKTAKEGQSAVFGSLRGSFNLRGGWYKQSNKLGIKVKSAKRTDLSAEVRTDAEWLDKQKKGGTIHGSENVRTFHYKYGGVRYIAEPSHELRPKGSKKIITKSLWPSRLRKRKRAFVIKSRKSGTPVLMVRFAPGKDGYTPMYVLRRDISITPTDAFYDPITKVVKRRLPQNIAREIENALRSAR